MTRRVIVVGGGVGGLGSALALARAGHQVTLLERDPLPEPTTPAEAFRAERRGAPQSHQTHGFLARLQVLLRDRFPDVLDDLLAVGCTTMSLTANLGEPRPGDEDIKVLIVRRTTLDWVLRRAVLAQPGAEIRTGVAVAGLVAGDGPRRPHRPHRPHPGEPPTVTGVRLRDGSVLDADLVVVAGGRRSPLPAWLADVGVTVPEEVVESGLMYVSRWYRFPEGPQALDDPKLGGDLGFVKFLGVPGDGDSLSVTLAVRTRDAALRAALATPDRFDMACRLLPGPDVFFADGPRSPLSGVLQMGGLLNRIRRFVDDDGHPLVRGVHAVGDAHTCTNPLYGRGCTLAMVQAVLLADALAEHPDDLVARSAAYEAACAREVEPWYHSALELDRAGADPAGLGPPASTGADGSSGAGGSGADGSGADGSGADGSPAGDGDHEPDPDGPGMAASPRGRAMAAVFAAAATDPVIGRAIVRFWNLLATPAELMADAELMARMARVMARPEDHPQPVRDGPSRQALLEALATHHDPQAGPAGPAGPEEALHA